MWNCRAIRILLSSAKRVIAVYLCLALWLGAWIHFSPFYHALVDHGTLDPASAHVHWTGLNQNSNREISEHSHSHSESSRHFYTHSHGEHSHGHSHSHSHSHSHVKTVGSESNSENHESTPDQPLPSHQHFGLSQALGDGSVDFSSVPFSLVILPVVLDQVFVLHSQFSAGTELNQDQFPRPPPAPSNSG